MGLLLVSAAAAMGSIALATALAGLGLGLVMPNLMAAAMALAAPQVRGRVAGGMSASLTLGMFASPLLSQPWVGTFGYSGVFSGASVGLIAMGLVAVAVALARRV